jgi:hypothetical protein
MWNKAQKLLKIVGMSGVITMGGSCGDVGETLFFVFQIVDVWT